MRKLQTQMAAAIALSTLFLYLNAGTAKADSVATISVNAAFADMSFNPTPDFYITGDFTLDATTSTITVFDMAFLGQNASAYQFSSQTGGISEASCVGVMPSPICFTLGGGASFWDLGFSDTAASIHLFTLFNYGEPLSAGNVFYLCAEEETFYSGGVFQSSPGCAATSSASFGGGSGFIYNPPPGSIEVTSGYLTVTSYTTPEPSDLAMLFLGLAVVFGIRRFTHHVPTARETIS